MALAMSLWGAPPVQGMRESFGSPAPSSLGLSGQARPGSQGQKGKQGNIGADQGRHHAHQTAREPLRAVRGIQSTRRQHSSCVGRQIRPSFASLAPTWPMLAQFGRVGPGSTKPASNSGQLGPTRANLGRMWRPAGGNFSHIVLSWRDILFCFTFKKYGWRAPPTCVSSGRSFRTICGLPRVPEEGGGSVDELVDKHSKLTGGDREARRQGPYQEARPLGASFGTRAWCTQPSAPNRRP